MCNSGVGLTPVIDGQVHHFSAGGLYNGLVLLIDDETRTYWDHITGEAVHGPLVGARLDHWGIEISTVGAQRTQHPELQIYRSRPSLKVRLISWLMNRPFMNGRFPPGFRDTMAAVDDRLDTMCPGLGVVLSDCARFYPKDIIGDGIDDEFCGQSLRIAIGKDDSVPFAVAADGSRPLQLFSRWYGFCLTWPDCEVYSA